MLDARCWINARCRESIQYPESGIQHPEYETRIHRQFFSDRGGNLSPRVEVTPAPGDFMAEARAVSPKNVARCHPQNWRDDGMNRRTLIPTGLCHPAQGCEERATLGSQATSLSTLKELRRCFEVLRHSSRPRLGKSAATLSGLTRFSSSSPRVARASQPWAEGCDPFGIAVTERGAAPFTP